MSRDWEGEYDDEYSALHQGRFDHNLKTCFKSNRGKKYLEDFIASLEAMEFKELIHGSLARPFVNDWLEISYRSCAIGAYAIQKGVDPKTLAHDYDYQSTQESIDVGINLGMAGTMAWAIGYTNDYCRVNSDKERWFYMYNWAKECLRLGTFIEPWFDKWVPMNV